MTTHKFTNLDLLIGGFSFHGCSFKYIANIFDSDA